jgi:hypothetical protein
MEVVRYLFIVSSVVVVLMSAVAGYASIRAYREQRALNGFAVRMRERFTELQLMLALRDRGMGK